MLLVIEFVLDEILKTFNIQVFKNPCLIIVLANIDNKGDNQPRNIIINISQDPDKLVKKINFSTNFIKISATY